MEIIQMAVNWWTDKQMIIYSYKQTLLRNKNEWNIDTCYNISSVKDFRD